MDFLEKTRVLNIMKKTGSSSSEGAFTFVLKLTLPSPAGQTTKAAPPQQPAAGAAKGWAARDPGGGFQLLQDFAGAGQHLGGDACQAGSGHPAAFSWDLYPPSRA